MSVQTDPSQDQNSIINGTEAPDPPSFSTTNHANPITLQVGERRFTTFATTLTPESPYFACLLSAQWQRPRADGSYFIDADGDLFSHILQYLRSGVLPIFYSSQTGHDYGTYRALLGEAEYFGIEPLKDWLKNKEYDKVVKVECSIEEIEGLPRMARISQANVQIEYHPKSTTEKVYICPRGVPAHDGNPSFRGRQCEKARGDVEVEFREEVVWKTMIISRQTVLNNTLGIRD